MRPVAATLIYSLVLVVQFCLPWVSAFGSPVPGSLPLPPVMSAEDALEIIRAGEWIEDARIEAQAIVDALVEGLPVWVKDCVVEGNLDLTELPRTTLLSDLKDDLPSEVYEELRVKYGPNLLLAAPSLRIYRSEVTGILDSGARGYVEAYPRVLFRDCAFAESTFREQAYFFGAVFKNPIAPTGAFQGVVFEKGADFWGAVFTHAAQFAWAEFKGEARFEETQFRGPTFFHYVAFEDVDFHRAQFLMPTDFTATTFNGTIDLHDTSLDHVVVSWGQLRGKKLSSYGDFDGQVYVRLIARFEELEQFADADSAYLAYRVAKRVNTKLWYDPTRFLEWVLLDLSCGYGVRPFRALLYGGGIIVIFALMFVQPGALQAKPETRSNLRRDGRKARFVSALYFSITAFAVLGHGIWQPARRVVTFPLPHLRIKRIQGRRATICVRCVHVPLGVSFHTLALVERLAGWLVMVLFVVSLTKVWIR